MYRDIIDKNPTMRKPKKTTGSHFGEGLGLGGGGATYRFLLDFDLGTGDPP